MNNILMENCNFFQRFNYHNCIYYNKNVFILFVTCLKIYQYNLQHDHLYDEVELI